MKRRIFYTLLTSVLVYAVFFDLTHVSSLVSAVTSGWAVNGDDVYFTDGNVGIGNDDPLSLVHVSNTPTDPSKVSEVHSGQAGFTNLNGSYIDVKDNYVYAVGDRYVSILDYIDPYNPIRVGYVYDGDGEFNKLYTTRGVAVSGDYLYVISADGGGALTIMDVSDPTDPVLESEVYDGDGEFDYLDQPGDIKIVDNYAYVTSTTERRISIIDVSDPTNPEYVSSIFISWHTSSPLYLAQDGNYLYVGVDDSVGIYDITNRTSPVKKSHISDGATYIKLNGVRRIYADNNILFVPSLGEDAVTLVDVSDPTSPSLLDMIYDGDGTFSKLDNPRQISVYRNVMAITAFADAAVTFVDITDPSDVTLIHESYDGDGDFDYLQNAITLVNDGRYFYVGYNYVTTIGNVLEEEILSIKSDGAVGIGVLEPAATLDLNGFMKMKINSAAPVTCDSSAEGSIAVSSNHYTCICDGSSWVKTADGSTSCTW